MRTRDNDDAALIARRVREFFDEHALQFLMTSDHTLKAYRDALSLYFAFLQAQGVRPATLKRAHLERPWIER